MARPARKFRNRSSPPRAGTGPTTAEARSVIDLKSLKRDAFHLIDLGGVPHAIRWTSDDYIELYEVVEG